MSVGGADVTHLDPGDRDLAMVFQDHALYPHLDVATNIGFPLMARKLPKDQIVDAVRQAAETLDLTQVLRRRPSELSGGERRRVSLARAVVREPAAFLMDEPLSSLDAALKLRVEGEIRTLQRRLGVTTIYVTHDQTEAMTLGDRIAVLRWGALEQIGTPLELYDEPANVFVATFLGRAPMNLFPADRFGAAREAETLGVRPEHLYATAPDDGRLRGTVAVVDQLGSETLVEVDVDGQKVFVRTERGDEPTVGTEVGLSFADERAYRFGPDGSRLTS